MNNVIDVNDADCRCPYLYLGLTRTEVRNWSERCPVHGYETTWYADRCAADPRFERFTDERRAWWHPDWNRDR